jgi:hypothetical protein
VYTVKIKTQNKNQVSITQVLLTEDKEDNMELKQWELSFGLFTGLLFGYRSYPDIVDNKVDHVIYLFIFDVCLTLKY